MSKSTEWIENPHDHDVLSGRGNFVNYHAGNEFFRALVRKYKRAYVACPKPQKGNFSRLIVDEIKLRNPPGRFLKQDPNTKLWYDIGDKKALDKTRQALREGAPDIAKELGGDDGDLSDENVSSHQNECIVSQNLSASVPCPQPQNNFAAAINNQVMNGLPQYTNQVENYISSNVPNMPLASVTPNSSLHSNSGPQNNYLGNVGLADCNGQGYSPASVVPTNPMDVAFLMRHSQQQQQQQQPHQQRSQISLPSAINYPVNNIHCSSFATVAGLEPNNVDKYGGGFGGQFEQRPMANVQYSAQHDPIVLEKETDKNRFYRYPLKDNSRFHQDKINDSDHSYEFKNSWHYNKATAVHEPVILEKDVEKSGSLKNLSKDYTRAPQTVDMHSSSRSIDVDNVFEMRNNWQLSNRDLKSRMNMSGMSLDEEADMLSARLNSSLRINGSSHTKSTNNPLPPLSKPPPSEVLTADKNMSSVLQMSVNTLGDSFVDFNDSTFKMTDSQAQMSIADVFEEADRELVSSRY